MGNSTHILTNGKYYDSLPGDLIVLRREDGRFYAGLTVWSLASLLEQDYMVFDTQEELDTALARMGYVEYGKNGPEYMFPFTFYRRTIQQ